MTGESDVTELDALRAELADRLRAYRPSTWSPELLAVVVNAIDIEFGAKPAPFKLRLVK